LNLLDFNKLISRSRVFEISCLDVLFNLERFDGVHLLDLFVDENLSLHAKIEKKLVFKYLMLMTFKSGKIA
jgi:hypothetical protein